MFAALDWSNLDVAGAFVVGALVGGVAVIRVFRYVLDYLARHGKRE